MIDISSNITISVIGCEKVNLNQSKTKNLTPFNKFCIIHAALNTCSHHTRRERSDAMHTEQNLVKKFFQISKDIGDIHI